MLRHFKGDVNMKKAYSIITSLVLALCVMCGTIVATPVMALAADSVDTAEVSVVQPRQTVYYPISGLSSGYFTGLECTSPAVFKLPAGTYTIHYNYDAQNTLGKLVFERSGERKEVVLYGNGQNRTGTVTLSGGTYTVKVTSGVINFEKYYGYDIVK